MRPTEDTYRHKGLRKKLVQGIQAPVAWHCDDTYIQRDCINEDFGLFDDPDAFYARHEGPTCQGQSAGCTSTSCAT